MPKFAERLRLLRTSKDLSQADFAKQLKISKSSVNMYERGEREPNFRTLEMIADYFNVDMDYLLGKSDISNKSYEKAPAVFDKRNPEECNVLRIAGRDGTFRERVLSDQQLAALIAIVDQMPDVPDDL